MSRRGGTVIVIIAVLLAVAAAVHWLSSLAVLPALVALHYLERLLYWVNVAWHF